MRHRPQTQPVGPVGVSKEEGSVSAAAAAARAPPARPNPLPGTPFRRQWRAAVRVGMGSFRMERPEPAEARLRLASRLRRRVRARRHRARMRAAARAAALAFFLATPEMAATPQPSALRKADSAVRYHRRTRPEGRAAPSPAQESETGVAEATRRQRPMRRR